MEHPHFSGECTLNMEEGELSCDNVPRFRAPRLKDDGETIEVTCMMQAHTVTLDELPDETLETLTRRLFERDPENRDEERERFLAECDVRGVTVPAHPSAVSWNVVELTEAETRELEDGAYPEAYQMSQTTGDETDAGETVRAMKISDWALRNVPEEIADRAVPLEESEYDHSFFG